ncbi:MAG: MBL fold metallo-hydrolase, partial [Oscillospiraceae bacterium]|nr:MBL fold metallo-hydrolase [Oscillospiraceae bacterium]
MPVESVKISDGAFRIEQGQGMVRSYLFVGSGKALLVDTGIEKESGLRAEAEKLAQGVPVILVTTHADGDHTAGDAEFADAHYMHPAELAHYLSRRGDKTPVTHIKPLWEGDIIDLGGRKFEVLLIPGHTPGSIALLDRANKILV